MMPYKWPYSPTTFLGLTKRKASFYPSQKQHNFLFLPAGCLVDELSRPAFSLAAADIKLILSGSFLILLRWVGSFAVNLAGGPGHPEEDN